MRALLVLLVGCNQIYDLEPTSIEGVKQCAGVRFGPAELLTGFDGDPPEYDPQINRDGTELFFHHAQSDPNLYRATRPNRSTPFGPPTIANFPNTTGLGDPALSGDGKRLVAIDVSDMTVYEGVRSDPSQPFTDIPRIVNGLDVPGGQFRGLDLSHDGLTIYYEMYGGDLWTAHRPSLDERFVDNRRLLTGIDFPTVSPDGREVFYVHFNVGDGGPIYRRIRADENSDFGDEEPILDNAADADVSDNAELMTVYMNRGIAILERACP